MSFFRSRLDHLYSLKEVAKILRVSERSIFRYIHSGRLGAIKIGYWRIKASDLDRFLNSNSRIRRIPNGKRRSVKRDAKK